MKDSKKEAKTGEQHAEKSGGGCGEGCGCKSSHSHEISIEQVVSANNALVNILIDLLIEKNVISEEELRKKLAALQKRE